MNHVLRTLLSRSIYWNSFESISYQLILCLHQAAIFYILSSQEYGMVGVLFSTVYAIGSMANLGLDTALGSWWAVALKGKKSFCTLVISQLIPQIIVAVILAITIVYFYPVDSRIEYSLLFFLGALAVQESIKKSLKICMYLLFANHIVAPTEVLLITIYTAIVWLLYYWYGTLSLHTIFIPMIVTTTMSILVYAYHLHSIYKDLSNEDTPASISLREIALIRASNYATQLTHLIFSGNILIPLFAHRFGLTIAGSLKFIDTIAYSIGTIMRKVVGTTGQALFAHTKSMEKKVQAALFASITNQAYQIIYVLLIFFLINGTKVNHSTILNIGMGAAILYGLLILTENIFYVYEQFFVTHDRAYYSALFNGVSFLLTYALLYGANVPLSTLLIILVFIRIVVLSVLELVTRAAWGAKSNLRVQPLYGISALAISLFVFFMW